MKSCKNCGSPVHGYADTCGGIACKFSMDQHDYLWRCDQCGRETPAMEKYGPKWQARHCPECRRTTMHYRIGRQTVEYYSQITNKKDCVCRPWPIMTAAQADDEIARLRAHNSQLRADNAALRSLNKSLFLANEELREVVRKVVSK